MAWFWNKKKTSDNQITHRYPIVSRSAGEVVTPETSKKVAAYYRGLVYISTQMAKLPKKIKKRNNEEVFDKIYELVNVAPNDEMNTFDFWVNIIQQAIDSGNGYAEIERTVSGNPVALHLLENKDVQKWRAPDGKIVYQVRGDNPQADVYLPSSDVLHIKNFVTQTGQIGVGLTHYASQTLGIALSANNHAGNLYSNGGMPSGVLEVSGILSDEAYERIKTQWREQTGGKKSGSTAILEEGMKYSPISMNPEALQFLESRKFGVLELARFLGLPPTKLFDGDAATYNNIEHSNLEVATDTLDAWAKNLEAEIDFKLLNKQRNGLRCDFDMYAVFRGDMKTRSDYFKTMMQNGAITPNQIRHKEGEAPYEGGDRYYISTNNFTPSDRLDEVIDSQIKPKETPAPQNNNNDDDELNNVALDFLRARTRN